MIPGMYALLRPNVPVITHIERESIMGNSENMTYKYYLGLDVLSYMDSVYRINYTFKGMDYSIICDNESYHDVMEYIKNVDFNVQNNNVFKVFNRDGDEITYDYLCFAGPMCDFYSTTSFNSKPEFFSDTDIFVIDSRFNMKRIGLNSYINPTHRRMSF